MYVVIESPFFGDPDRVDTCEQDWAGFDSIDEARAVFDKWCHGWADFGYPTLIGWRVDLVEVPTDRWQAIADDVDLWLWDDIGWMRWIDTRVEVRDGVDRRVILPDSIAVGHAIDSLAPEVES